MVTISVPMVGCMQAGEIPEGFEKNDDCLFCHSTYRSTRVRDMRQLYDDKTAHHPVEIPYPPFHGAQNFNLPNAKNNEHVYFDSNGNGKMDISEIRLFPDGKDSEITCSTCHREHNKSPVVVEDPDDDFLRGTNIDGELCSTCHRKPPSRPIPHH